MKTTKTISNCKSDLIICTCISIAISVALRLHENVLSVRWNDVFIYKMTVVRISSRNCFCSSINQCLMCVLFLLLLLAAVMVVFFCWKTNRADVFCCTSCVHCTPFRSACGHVTFDRMFESKKTLSFHYRMESIAIFSLFSIALFLSVSLSIHL